MVITSLASTTSMGTVGRECLASSARTTLGGPTSTILTPYSSAARTLPSTSGRGAWSPPMASTAIVIMEFFPETPEQRRDRTLGLQTPVTKFGQKAEQYAFTLFRRLPDSPGARL